MNAFLSTIKIIYISEVKVKSAKYQIEENRKKSKLEYRLMLLFLFRFDFRYHIRNGLLFN